MKNWLNNKVMKEEKLVNHQSQNQKNNVLHHNTKMKMLWFKSWLLEMQKTLTQTMILFLNIM